MSGDVTELVVEYFQGNRRVGFRGAFAVQHLVLIVQSVLCAEAARGTELVTQTLN